MVIMFGMVVASGIKMLSTVDFQQQSNLLVIACSISLGLGSTVVPDLFAQLPPMLRILFSDGIITGSLTAIFLNLFFHHFSLKKSSAAEQLKPTTIKF